MVATMICTNTAAHKHATVSQALPSSYGDDTSITQHVITEGLGKRTRLFGEPMKPCAETLRLGAAILRGACTEQRSDQL